MSCIFGWTARSGQTSRHSPQAFMGLDYSLARLRERARVRVRCMSPSLQSSPSGRGSERRKNIAAILRTMAIVSYFQLTRREQSLMSLLRYRRQFGGDQRPALAVIFAAENFAAGGAAENGTGAIGFFETERAEFMFQAIGQPAAEPLPVLAAIFAPVDFSFGARLRPGLPPGGRVVFGGCDEHEIGVFRIPKIGRASCRE